MSPFVCGNPPKWPINNKKHAMLARQAAMVRLHQEGVTWSGSPSNDWLSEQMGEPIFQWWKREGRALCAMSHDELIFDEASW